MSALVILAIIVTLIVVLVVILTAYVMRATSPHRPTPVRWIPLPGAGLSVMVEDRTEDQPVETIDEALAQTTDPAQRDALLDVRLRAMGGAE